MSMITGERQAAQAILRLVYAMSWEELSQLSVDSLRTKLSGHSAQLPTSLREVGDTMAFLAQVEKLAGALTFGEIASLSVNYPVDQAFLAQLNFLRAAGQLPCMVIPYLHSQRVSELRRYLHQIQTP